MEYPENELAQKVVVQAFILGRLNLKISCPRTSESKRQALKAEAAKQTRALVENTVRLEMSEVHA